MKVVEAARVTGNEIKSGGGGGGGVRGVSKDKNWRRENDRDI